MKTILLLLTFSVFSQEKPAPFHYSWNVSNNQFNVVFKNEQFRGVTQSNEPFGYFSANCREAYIEIIVKLLTYGNMPSHVSRGQSLNVFEYLSAEPALKFILEPSHPFILIKHSSGSVWKLSKPTALILAFEMQNDFLYNQLTVCGCQN